MGVDNVGIGDAERSVDLWARARAGERHAMQELLSRYVPRLSRWASGRLPTASRSVEETTDLVQQTLLQLLQRGETFEPRHDGALSAYLRTALLNNLRQRYRRLGGRPEPETLDPERRATGGPSPLDDLLCGDVVERYETALALLSETDRQAIILRLELGHTYAEVAEAMGIPTTKAAHMRVSRATLRLAEAMRTAARTP